MYKAGPAKVAPESRQIFQFPGQNSTAIHDNTSTPIQKQFVFFFSHLVRPAAQHRLQEDKNCLILRGCAPVTVYVLMSTHKRMLQLIICWRMKTCTGARSHRLTSYLHIQQREQVKEWKKAKGKKLNSVLQLIINHMCFPCISSIAPQSLQKYALAL